LSFFERCEGLADGIPTDGIVRVPGVSEPDGQCTVGAGRLRRHSGVDDDPGRGLPDAVGEHRTPGDRGTGDEHGRGPRAGADRIRGAGGAGQ
jgi:hypothetical protein